MLHFLFSFDGRINRLKMWMFSIGASVARLIAGILASNADIGSPLNEWMYSRPPRNAHSFMADWLASSSHAHAAFLALKAFDLLVFCVSLPVVTKRVHDLAKPAWWIIPLWIVPQSLAALSSVLARPGYMAPLLIWLPFAIVLVGFGFWGFVQLFCYSGSFGENEYGPDPLGGPVVNPFQGEKAG